MSKIYNTIHSYRNISFHGYRRTIITLTTYVHACLGQMQQLAYCKCIFQYLIAMFYGEVRNSAFTLDFVKLLSVSLNY